MPIYQFECTSCGHLFERLKKKTDRTWQQEERIRYKCPACLYRKAKKLASGFKIGSGVLDTTGHTGYETDELTLGKIVDNDGKIPWEYKEGLRRRAKTIKRQKQHTKELIARGKKYNFDPFSIDD